MRKILANRLAVDRNEAASHDVLEHVFTVIDDQDGVHYASNMILTGPSELKYDPAGTVGNRLWIETFDKVILKFESNLDGTPCLLGV